MMNVVKLVSCAGVALALGSVGCAADDETLPEPSVGTTTNSTVPPAESELDTVPVEKSSLPGLTRTPKRWDTVQDPTSVDVRKARRPEPPADPSHGD
jgi:hypothetical protein